MLFPRRELIDLTRWPRRSRPCSALQGKARVAAIAIALALAAAAAQPRPAAAWAGLLPHAAKEFRVFRAPITVQSTLTPDQRSRLNGPGHTWLWDAIGGVILSQARRVPGSPWIAIPGRVGLEFMYLLPDGGNPTVGAFYRNAHSGGFAGTLNRCQHNQSGDVTTCLDADGGHVDFFQVVPDNVRSAVIAGACIAAVDGVVVGSTTYVRGEDVFRSFGRNNKRWKAQAARSRRTAHRPAQTPPTESCRE